MGLGDGFPLHSTTELTIKKYVHALNRVVIERLHGETMQDMTFINTAFEDVPLPDTVPGFEVDQMSVGRIVTFLSKGSPKPRLQFMSDKNYFIRPQKIGGRVDWYDLDILGQPMEIQDMRTRRLQDALIKDIQMTRQEFGALTLANSFAARQTVDLQDSNVVQGFTLTDFHDMLAKRRQNQPVDNLDNLVAYIPSVVERALRRDDAFDDVPDLKGRILTDGRLPERLEGINDIRVADWMPIKYDAAGNMRDAGSAPTGVIRLPVQITDNPQKLPIWLRDGAIPTSHLDADHIALYAWILEKNKMGYYVRWLPGQTFQPVDGPTKDPEHDSWAVFARDFFNVGIPDDTGEGTQPEGALPTGSDFGIVAENILYDRIP